MISQSSSEASICLAVPTEHGERAERAIKAAFRAELARGEVEEIAVERDVALVAVVGLGMAQTPGVSGRLFGAIGRQGVNILAIAQGTTELNITFAVAESEVDRAIREVHAEFGLHRQDTGAETPGGLDLILLGCGQIGQALVGLLKERTAYFQERFGAAARVVGMADRSGYVHSPRGLSTEELAAALVAKASGAPLASVPGGVAGPSTALLDAALSYRLARPVVVDVTDAEDAAAAWLVALRGGADLVTANKKPLAGSLASYEELREAARATGRHLKAEATVGAGLPVMDTLEMLLAAGDRVRSARGCFSGTLGFVLGRVQEGATLSEAVAEAREAGYTEPDPVADLSGADMARKAVILGRLTGLVVTDRPSSVVGLVDPGWAGLPWETLRERGAR